MYENTGVRAHVMAAELIDAASTCGICRCTGMPTPAQLLARRPRERFDE
jgi:hypothetical protein